MQGIFREIFADFWSSLRLLLMQKKRQVGSRQRQVALFSTFGRTPLLPSPEWFVPYQVIINSVGRVHDESF